MMHGKDAIDEEVLRWVARMDSGVWGVLDEAELNVWLGENKEKAARLLYAQATWLSLDRQEAAEATPVAEQDRAPAMWRRRSVLVGVAASAVLGVGLGTYLRRAQAYSTRMGEIRRVPLNDGSVMMINSDTDLAVRMESHVRHVEITKGEAWFEVAKDAARPFVVASGKVRAQAVGTAFSVRKREAGVEVLVTEGIVESWATSHDMSHLRLLAGQRVMITENSVVHYEGVASGAVDKALAWRDGMIDLSNVTLADAAEEFNRYNTRQILVADPRMAGERMAGVFRINDPHGFVLAIKNTLNVKIDDSNPDIIRIDGIASDKQ